MVDVHVLGIRHHGPGSARAVARALDEVRPGVVVIEGPPELDSVVALAASPHMAPPVAGLVYDVAQPRRASFYPMAVFSPEWVAMRWALDQNVSVRFADLPAVHELATGANGEEPGDVARAEDGDLPARPPAAAVVSPIVTDPIGTLAHAAGFDDAERWWEDAVEQRAAGDAVLDRFAAVRDAMAELRRQVTAEELPDSARTLAREAAMRRVLRAVVGDATRPVVVVCGAFHAPVLVPEAWPSASADNARLKGLPRTKVAATWAPWTTGRLAFASGYGAGVTAPGWYEHLFTTTEDVIGRWMVRTASLLRGEGHDASPASVVEATRLADALAALRGRPATGLDEVTDATRTVLCHGSALPMRAIAEDLLVGRALGSVPYETPMVPLAEDLAGEQRRLRVAPSAQRKTIVLDLRRRSQLERSILFRRLALLGVHWAVEAEAGRTTGTFKEAWQVEWVPELAVAVIEASLHGTTVASAAAAKVADDARTTEGLAPLAALIGESLAAELPHAVAAVLDRLADRTAVASDHLEVMRTVEPLARAQRYGDVRGVDTSVVRDVLVAMVTRAAVGLDVACVALDDEAAASTRAAIESVERGVSLVADDDLRDVWHDALAGLVPTVHGSVAGRIARLLLDATRLDAAEAGRRLARALSLAGEPRQAAAWLDGFLAGDAVLLLHDPDVFGVIDAWIAGLDDDVFEDLLPLARRTFSRFEKSERRAIGELVTRGATGAAAPDRADDLDDERARAAVAHMAALLGLEPAAAPWTEEPTDA